MGSCSNPAGNLRYPCEKSAAPCEKTPVTRENSLSTCEKWCVPRENSYVGCEKGAVTGENCRVGCEKYSVPREHYHLPRKKHRRQRWAPPFSPFDSLNHRNRLVGVRQGEATVAGYGLNALGQRTSKTVDDTTTHFHYGLDNKLLAESTEAGVIERNYVYLNDQVIAIVDAK